MDVYTERFTGKAAEYAQYRERYDPEVVLPLLREWCGLSPSWQVADVGAGTGMVGDLFRVNANPVIAVEPNAEMRAVCASLHAEDMQLSIAEGSAEATGLPDSAVDLIAVGRALHWFNVEAAFREFRRILKPKGWVAILASGRAEDGREENRAFKQLMQDRTSRDCFQDKLHKAYGRMDALFPGGRFCHAEVAGQMCLDWDQLRGLTLSLSHSPMPGAPDFPAFEAALRGLFDRYAQNDRVTMTTRTWVSAGQFAE